DNSLPTFQNFIDVTNFVNSISGKVRREVVYNVYDVPSYEPTQQPFDKLPHQTNLKNRISCVKYIDYLSAGYSAKNWIHYTNAIHYTYDILGNVKTLIYDLHMLMPIELRFKRVDYEYDLYSGKVVMLSYNRGWGDQFYQRYKYDEDNRITEVYTSRDGLVWDRDAKYEYYDHGPLARMTLGNHNVQGVDYAYTINGWLKAINGFQNDTLSDMGGDGKLGMVFPRDAFSQRIDYFTKDYRAIGDTNFMWEYPYTYKSLYNGNIAAIAKALAPFGNLQSRYNYDQLQRIEDAEYAEYNYNFASSTATTNLLPDYRTSYAYDLDGNLKKLYRQGGTVPAAL